MKKENAIYVYSGIALVLAVGAYLLITSGKKNKNNTKEEVSAGIETPSGTIIDSQQAQIPKELSAILNLDVATVSKALTGKNLYTKVSDVNARYTPKVNNGTVNNLFGVIKNSGMHVGTVKKVVADENNAKNANGKTNYWFMVHLSRPAIEAIQKSRGSSSIVLNPNLAYPVYLREDTISLK